MNLNNPINYDHELLMLELQPDELEMAKVCAIKVKAHLEKLCRQNAHYLPNLTVVNSIISQYEEALNCGNRGFGWN